MILKNKRLLWQKIDNSISDLKEIFQTNGNKVTINYNIGETFHDLCHHIGKLGTKKRKKSSQGAASCHIYECR